MTQQQQQKPAKGGRPNIILILVDDMGFSDIGCYGSEIETPNLDRLAAGGMRFSQMYNCGRCCPTRASLLTGLQPHQTGVGFMVGNYQIPAYQGFLNDRCVTIAEALRLNAYNTMMVGKWHVGGHYPPGEQHRWRPGTHGFPIPITRGFLRHYGTLAGAANYYDPLALIRDDRLLPRPEPGYYYTDAISDEAVKMIEQAHRQSQPFFLYVAYTAPHWPLHAPAEAVEKYRGRYSCGWDPIRTARHERLKAEGILDPKWPISPRDPDAPPFEDVDHKDWQDARMAVYAAQIDIMDQGVGRIMAKLGELGIEDDTLVIFMSDNGGCAEFLKEDGRYQSMYSTHPHGDKIRLGNIPEIMPGPEESFQSYGLPWANASNTPFRLYKHWVHEGGIATPMIAYWPGVIQPGTVRHEVCHVIDIMPTFLDVAGATYPESYNGRAITPLEGESLLPVLEGKKWSRQRPLGWEHEGNRAFRIDNWKIVSKYPGRWELYDMNEDRTELNDLAEVNQGKVRQLEAAYNEWAARCDVMDWDRVKWW